MYTEKELKLAKRYLGGDCNDLQMNYIIQTENLNRGRVEGLISALSIGEPMIAFAKVMLAFMLLHFTACLLYAFLHSF